MQVPAKIVKELLRTLPKDCEIYKKLYDAVKKEWENHNEYCKNYMKSYRNIC